MPNQPLLGLHRLLAALIGLVVFVVGIGLSVRLLLMDYRQVHQHQAERMFSEVESVVTEFQTVLTALNRQNHTECNEQTLVAMRREVFLAEHVKDIGFLKGDQVVCTTGIGMLDKPISMGQQDYVGLYGLQVYIDVPLQLFDEEYRALVVWDRQFDAVFDLAQLSRIESFTDQWQLVYRRDGLAVSVAGREDVYQGAFADKGYQFDLSTQYSEFCLPSVYYCMGVASDFRDWLAHYRTMVIVLMMFWFLAGVFAAFGVRRLLTRRLAMKAKVRRALRKKAFYSLYQPIYDLTSGQMIGCEALARCDLKGEKLFPDQFIPEIARSGQSWQFTEHLIQQSLRELAAEPTLPDRFRVNFNLFPLDIAAAHTRRFAELADVQGSRFHLVLEVTEDQQLEGAQAQAELIWLKEQGYGVALDDFGTGYSNLNQIRDFHADALKIDRSFITDLEDGSIRSSLIPYIVDIAYKLNLAVVAEGIENAQQQQALFDMGVQYGQGYYFGKPMTAKELVRLYQRQS